MGRGAKVSLPANVSSFVDRHGKERFRYRKAGLPVYYFKLHPGTKKNPSAEYKALIARKGAPETPRAEPGTIDDLLSRYYGSTGFRKAGEVTRQKNRATLEEFRAAHGTKRVASIQFQHVEAILIAKGEKGVNRKGRAIGGPEASDRLRKNLRRIFKYAVRLKMIEVNPVDLAETTRPPRTTGFHSWTDEEIAQYRARHPLGTKPRLALEIVLWTLQRRDDARLFGPAHLRGGRINYTQGKGGKNLWLPAAPQLLSAISAMPAVGMTSFLVTAYGKPFTNAGFGNWFKDQCVAAGLPHCTLHGLRKAMARKLAEHGGTQQELKASGGWSNDREVATYTAAADQERLAALAMTRVAQQELATLNSGVANRSAEGADNA